MRKPEWYQDNQVDLPVGTGAPSIDRDARRVELANRPGLSYDHLLLATGSTARRLTLPGAQLDGVYELRTVAALEPLIRTRTEVDVVRLTDPSVPLESLAG